MESLLAEMQLVKEVSMEEHQKKSWLSDQFNREQKACVTRHVVEQAVMTCTNQNFGVTNY